MLLSPSENRQFSNFKGQSSLKRSCMSYMYDSAVRRTTITARVGVGCVVFGMGVWRYLGWSDSEKKSPRFFLIILKSPAEVFGETKASSRL